MFRILLFAVLFDMKHSVLSICSTQHYSISPQHYAEIFAPSSTVFSNIDALKCVYKCAVSDEDIGLRLAVHHQEPKLCSCVTRMLTGTYAQDNVGVQVVAVMQG